MSADTNFMHNEYPEKINIAAEAALEKKAEKVTVLDMRKLVSYTDYFIICGADSAVQVRAVADEIVSRMKKMGYPPLGTEGYADAGWVLIDYGEVIINVFLKEIRGFYELEKLWADAPCRVLEE